MDDEKLAIVNIHGLAEILLTTPSTLRKGWHRLPHFFIGEGRNLKSARFDVKKVVRYLEQETEEIKNRLIQNRKKKISNKTRCRRVGRGREAQDKIPKADGTAEAGIALLNSLL